MGLRSRGGETDSAPAAETSQAPLPTGPDHHVIIASLLLGFLALPGRLIEGLLLVLLGKHENHNTPGEYSSRVLLAGKKIKPIALWQLCDALDEINAWPHLILGFTGPIHQLRLKKAPKHPASPCLLGRHGLQVDRKIFEASAFAQGLAPSFAQEETCIPIIMDVRASYLSEDGFNYWTTPGPAVDELTGETRFLSADCWPQMCLFQTLAFVAKKRSEGCTEDEVIELLREYKPAGSSSVYFTRVNGKVGKTNGITHFTRAELTAMRLARLVEQGCDPDEVTPDDIVDQMALMYAHNSKQVGKELLQDRFGNRASDTSALFSISSTTMCNRVISAEGHLQKSLSQVCCCFLLTCFFDLYIYKYIYIYIFLIFKSLLVYGII